MTMAISGALLAGIGAATPIIGGVVAPDDPLRAGAVSAFVGTLTGRLTGAGLALIVLGLALRWRRARTAATSATGGAGCERG